MATRRPYSHGMSKEDAHERREALRRRLFEQQGGLCHLCGGLMTLERRSKRAQPSPSFATFDHLRPASEGGTAYYTNLALAHRRCNNARNSRPIGDQNAGP